MRPEHPENDRPAPPAWDVLDRYIRDEASMDEAAAIAAYFQSTGRKGGAAIFRDELRTPSGGPPIAPTSELFERLQARIGDAEPRESVLSGEPRRGGSRSGRMLWRLTAGGMAVVVGACLFWSGVLSTGRAPFGSSRASTQYTTRIGERATIRLVDGSRVTLAPQSVLTIAHDGVGRTLALDGEAHFDVVASVHSPLTVRTGAVTTQVLGTAFNVRHYPTDRDVRIVVAMGKVVARGSRTRMTLTAGMAAHVTDSTTVAVDVATEDVRWTNGQLIFHKTPTATLLATVGRWYGYEFRLARADSMTLASERVTAVFSVDAPQETMRLLADVLDATMTFDGHVVTLHRRGAGVRPLSQKSRINEVFLNQSEKGK